MASRNSYTKIKHFLSYAFVCTVTLYLKTYFLLNPTSTIHFFLWKIRLFRFSLETYFVRDDRALLPVDRYAHPRRACSLRLKSLFIAAIIWAIRVVFLVFSPQTIPPRVIIHDLTNVTTSTVDDYRSWHF